MTKDVGTRTFYDGSVRGVKRFKGAFSGGMGRSSAILPFMDAKGWVDWD